MAKPIYMTDGEIEDICAEIRRTLSGTKCYGAIDIKRSLKPDKRVASLYFTPLAWIKMTALVSRFETEVQWHGMVRRVSNDGFEVYDILVPPHEVSGATVTSEYKPYIEWLNSLDDDTFNAVRFHGHSHVDMGVTPSAVDNKYRLDLITQLPQPSNGDDVYYIFLIINKKQVWSAEIYDLTNNACYGTNEIYMECTLPEPDDLDLFVEAAKKIAVERPKYSYSSFMGKQYSSGSPGVSSATPGGKYTSSKSASSKGKVKAKDKREEIAEYYKAIYGDDYDETEDSYPYGSYYSKE